MSAKAGGIVHSHCNVRARGFSTVRLLSIIGQSPPVDPEGLPFCRFGENPVWIVRPASGETTSTPSVSSNPRTNRLTAAGVTFSSSAAMIALQVLRSRLNARSAFRWLGALIGSAKVFLLRRLRIFSVGSNKVNEHGCSKDRNSRSMKSARLHERCRKCMKWTRHLTLSFVVRDLPVLSWRDALPRIIT